MRLMDDETEKNISTEFAQWPSQLAGATIEYEICHFHLSAVGFIHLEVC